MTRRWQGFLALALVVLLLVIAGWLVFFRERGQEIRDRAELLVAKSAVAMGIEWKWAHLVVAIDGLERQVEQSRKLVKSQEMELAAARTQFKEKESRAKLLPSDLEHKRRKTEYDDYCDFLPFKLSASRAEKKED